MTTLVSDSFSRAATTSSATALGNADTGQTWKQEGNLYFYINSNGQAQSSGNESFAAVNAGASDVDVSCDIIPYATSANAGIAIRNDGSSENVSLFLRINGLNYEFYEQGATTSKLASQSASYSAGQTITLRMVAQGSTVTCYANGVQLFGQSFTVTENQTNTYHGLRFLDTSSADNFVINSVGGTTPSEIDASATGSTTGASSASATLILYATATGEATGTSLATTAGEVDASASGEATGDSSATGTVIVYAVAIGSASGVAVANAVIEVYGSAVGESSGSSSATPHMTLYASAEGSSVGDSVATALLILFAEAIGEATGEGLVNNFATIMSDVKILGSFGVKQSVQGSFQVKHSVKGEV